MSEKITVQRLVDLVQQQQIRVVLDTPTETSQTELETIPDAMYFLENYLPLTFNDKNALKILVLAVLSEFELQPQITIRDQQEFKTTEIGFSLGAIYLGLIYEGGNAAELGDLKEVVIADHFILDFETLRNLCLARMQYDIEIDEDDDPSVVADAARILFENVWAWSLEPNVSTKIATFIQQELLRIFFEVTKERATNIDDITQFIELHPEVDLGSALIFWIGQFT